jgi:hypothetical protein
VLLWLAARRSVPLRAQKSLQRRALMLLLTSGCGSPEFEKMDLLPLIGDWCVLASVGV